MAQRVKNLPARQETWVRSLGQEDPLEKETATHSSILSWEIPWTEEPDGLQSMVLQRVAYDWAGNTSFTMTAYNYFHSTDVETEARRLNGLLKVTEAVRGSSRARPMCSGEYNLGLVLWHSLPRRSSFRHWPMSPALAASHPHSPYGPQWALGPRDLPQGALAEYCQWATCQCPPLPSIQPPPPAPSQRQLTPGKFRVFPFQWAQPLLWFGCRQLQVPQVMMCSLPRLSRQCHHVYLLLWTFDSVGMPIGWAARHHSWQSNLWCWILLLEKRAKEVNTLKSG